MDRKGRNKQASHVWLYTDLLQGLKGERLSSVFSPDGTLISASAAPHCEATTKDYIRAEGDFHKEICS